MTAGKASWSHPVPEQVIMSNQESEGACPRCPGYVQLEPDEQDGFLLCPQCGFVAEEFLQLQPGNPQGTLVHEDDPAATVARFQACAGAGMSAGVGHAADAAEARQRRLRAAQDRLQGVASTMNFSQRHTDEATAMLKEVYEGHLVHLGGMTMGLDALCAAILLLVARINGLPVSLRDAAAAARANKQAAASFYRQLCAHAPDGQQQGPGATVNIRPSKGLRAFCLKLGSQLINTRPHTQAAGGGGGDGGGGVASEMDVRSHPFIKSALDLTDLVAKTGIGEGRDTPTLAGAILLLLGESKVLPVPSNITAAHLSTMVGCHAKTLTATRTLVQQHLLQLAALLPMGSQINKSNLLSYLPLIISATHVIVALKKGGMTQ